MLLPSAYRSRPQPRLPMCGRGPDQAPRAPCTCTRPRACPPPPGPPGPLLGPLWGLATPGSHCVPVATALLRRALACAVCTQDRQPALPVPAPCAHHCFPCRCHSHGVHLLPGDPDPQLGAPTNNMGQNLFTSSPVDSAAEIQVKMSLRTLFYGFPASTPMELREQMQAQERALERRIWPMILPYQTLPQTPLSGPHSGLGVLMHPPGRGTG